ncbi:sister chromatid cohesion protein DCC1 isoform X2 [Ranitomeya variabilis]|uniref:sister chromatid cohesion protein DCC1 isoform X2 n=1 Tax=Ranitomeya variabilis TaxID=490064 RepID=UPI0040566B83
MSRSREEVEATLQIAKLTVEDLRSSVQCLTFSASFSAGDYSLIELDETLCAEMEAGGSLVIRGDQGDHAVLCSQNQTYDLKIADTSNLLLFIPEGKTPDLLPNDQLPLSIASCEIAGFSNHYWELRRCRPKLKRLKKLLLENVYEGPENEQDASASVYTTEDLLNQIQASCEELMDHLKVIHACNIKGFWRLLDFDYEMKLLSHITQLMDSESWSFSRVPLKVCLEELRPLEPEQMIEHCLECYGERFSEDEEAFFALDEDKICRATAQMLLQNAVKFNLSEFQAVWQQSVPEGMTTRPEQLRGPVRGEANHRSPAD